MDVLCSHATLVASSASSWCRRREWVTDRSPALQQGVGRCFGCLSRVAVCVEAGVASSRLFLLTGRSAGGGGDGVRPQRPVAVAAGECAACLRPQLLGKKHLPAADRCDLRPRADRQLRAGDGEAIDEVSTPVRAAATLGASVRAHGERGEHGGAEEQLRRRAGGREGHVRGRRGPDAVSARRVREEVGFLPVFPPARRSSRRWRSAGRSWNTSVASVPSSRC